jgi:hypothetical protein
MLEERLRPVLRGKRDGERVARRHQTEDQLAGRGFGRAVL